MTIEKEFQIIPGIGKKLSQELIDLGYRKVFKGIDNALKNPDNFL